MVTKFSGFALTRNEILPVGRVVLIRATRQHDQPGALPRALADHLLETVDVGARVQLADLLYDSNFHIARLLELAFGGLRNVGLRAISDAAFF